MELFANIALGWSPILGVVSTNGSNILKVVGWTGGVGSIPATGVYVGSSGYVTNITDGIDIRGASGAGAAVIFSAGASSAGLASIIFSNSNGVAFGLNGSVVTASYTQAAQSSLIFSNTNGITFGTNAGTLTASVATNYQSQGAYLTTAQPIGAYLTTAMLSNASTLSNINVSIGTTSSNLSQIVFSNVNNISFGINGGTITGTASFSQSVQTQGTFPGSTVFSNSNGVSFGLVGSTITATVATNYQSQGAYLTTAMQSNAAVLSNINVSAGTLSRNISNLIFSNSNNLSFGFDGTVLTGSAAGFTQSVQTNNLVTIQGSTGPIVFSNSNGVSFGGNNGTITASVNAGAQTSVVFSNFNGVTFGLAGSTLTASVKTDYQSSNANYLTTAQPVGAYLTTAMLSNASTLSNIYISAGTTQSNLSALVFSNSNNVSFGLNGSVVTGTASFNQSVQTQGTFPGATVFSNSNGVTFGLVGSTITASVSQSVQTQGTFPGATVFSNSNGVSFGLNGSTVTATVATNYQSSNANYLTSQSNQAFSASGGSSAFQTLNFANSNGFTFSNTNGSVIGSYTVPSIVGLLTGINVSGGTTSNNLSAITFSNVNGVSFGLNGSVLTASVAAAGGAQTGVSGISAGTTIMTSGTAVFSNSNGITFGLNGNTITATVATNYQSQGAYLTTAMLSNAVTLSNINLSAGTTSGNLSAFVFSNSNNLSFGLNGSTVTGSFNQSVQTQGTFPGATSFSNANGVTFGLAGNTITASVSQSVQTQGTFPGATVFSNSNGVSFGLVGSTVTATVATNYQSQGAYLTTAMQSNAVTLSNINISGGTTSGNLSALAFTNANGVSFQLNGGVISASVVTNYQSQGAYLTTAMLSNAVTLSNINISAGTTSGNLSALTFTNANGVTFQLNGGVVSASVATNYQSQGAYLTTAALSQNTSNYAGINSAVTGASLTVNTSGISLNLPPYITTQSGQAFSAPGGSSAFQTLVFANSNGVSWSNSNGSVVGSVQTNYQSQGAYLTTAMASNAATVFSNSNNVSFGLAGSTVTATASFAQSNQNISLYAVGNTTGNSSTVLNANSLVFSQAGGATFGFSAGSIILSDATGGGGGITNINVSAGTTSGNLSNLIFSNLNGVSFGLNGSTITASAAGGGGGGGVAISASNSVFTSGTISFNNSGALTIGTGAQAINFSVPATSVLSASGGIVLSTNGNTISIGGPQAATLSRYEYPEGFFTSMGGISQGTLMLNHFYQPYYVTGTAMKIGGSLSAATNTSATTASINLSLWMGIYTLSGSTLSLASSGSANNGFQWSQSASSTANTSVNGMRQLTVPMNVNMTPGEYWAAAVISSATTYTSYTFTLYGYSGIAGAAGAAVLTPIGLNTSANRDAMLFQGLYTAATSSGPQSIIGSNVNNTGASAALHANYYFAIYNATY